MGQESGNLLPAMGVVNMAQKSETPDPESPIPLIAEYTLNHNIKAPIV